MLVSPVINPVVILSTWYAFNGNYKIIAARCGLGILCSVLCGLTYLFKPPVNYLVEYAMPIQAACGDYSLLEEKGMRVTVFTGAFDFLKSIIIVILLYCFYLIIYMLF